MALGIIMKGLQVFLALTATLTLSGAGGDTGVFSAALGWQGLDEPRFSGGKAQEPALLWLARSDREDGPDRAIAGLLRAVREAPDDPGLWSDLAAAHFVRARRRDDPYALIRAFEAVERAGQAGPAPLAAWFNRALILEHLSLSSAARDAWESYLALDPASDQAAAAREHLARLDVPPERSSWEEQAPRLEEAVARGDRETVEELVRRFPQAARESAELELPGRWADAHLAGDAARAAETLAVARAIGAAIATRQGDRLVAEGVAVLDAALAQGDAVLLERLARGHRALRDGHALYKEEAPDAFARLAQAQRDLATAESPFALLAVFYRGCIEYQKDRFSATFSTFQTLSQVSAGLPFASLLARVAWLEALARSALGDSMGAIRSYESAAASFRRLGEEDNAASMEALRGETLGQLGDGTQAWRACFLALRVAPRLQGPRARYRVFVPAADLLLQEGHEELALLFQDEVIRQAAHLSPRTHAGALAGRGLLLHRLGRTRDAGRDLRDAGARLDLQEDAARRARGRADLSLVEGTLALADEPLRAIELLTPAVRFYREVDQIFLSLLAARARARAYRLAGDLESAEADLRAGLQAYERLGWGVDRHDLHLAWLGASEELFEDMVALQTERGRDDLAFATADLARTRSLPGRSAELPVDTPSRHRLLATESRPLPRDEIRRRLAPGTTLVQYEVLDDRLLIWRLRRDAWSSIAVPVSRRELESLVAAFRAALRSGRPGDSSRLYDRLIRPALGERSAETRRLVLVADQVLHQVPFAALRDRRTGRLLVEDHEIALAPSATLAVRPDRRPARPALRDILLVGDPALDPALDPDLDPLPAAVAEVGHIASLHPPGRARVLVGAAADKATFLALAPGSRRIHLAVHAVANGRNPLSSRLLLTPAGGDTGALYAWEVHPLPLAGTELVVLAACDSGSDRSRAGEGVASLGRAFLAAGAQRVVASLWRVDDTGSERFFRAFYARLLAHSDPVRALREAQLAALRSSDEALRDPATWGAFEILAAGTD